MSNTYKIEIEVTNHGDVVSVYCPTMRYEGHCRHVDLQPSLSSLVQEWVEIKRADGDLPEIDADTHPYVLMIGGSKVEEAHSVKYFDTKEERLRFWRRYTAREYCWLPQSDSTFLPNTDENCSKAEDAHGR